MGDRIAALGMQLDGWKMRATLAEKRAKELEASFQDDVKKAVAAEKAALDEKYQLRYDKLQADLNANYYKELYEK